MAVQASLLRPGAVAVVTGGGRGIGRAVARALAREGLRVAVADVDEAAALRVAAELGPAHLGAALDVTDRPAFTAFLDDVERRLGPLEVIVNNAGIMPVGPFDEESDASATRQLELNLHAVIHGSKEAVRRMRPRRPVPWSSSSRDSERPTTPCFVAAYVAPPGAPVLPAREATLTMWPRPRGRGHIVNVASLAGKTGAPGGATYAATKHGVVGLSESLLEELHGTGLRVTVVMPALVATELSAGTREIRGVRRASADEVAEAVVDALRDGRFEVYVPRTLRPLVALAAVLPRRVRDPLVRLLANGALIGADRTARAAYEARAAASTPAADAPLSEERAA